MNARFNRLVVISACLGLLATAARAEICMTITLTGTQGGALTEDDYRRAVTARGFSGTTVVGTDLAKIKLVK